MYKTLTIKCKSCEKEFEVYVTDHTGQLLGVFYCPYCGFKYTK